MPIFSRATGSVRIYLRSEGGGRRSEAGGRKSEAGRRTTLIDQATGGDLAIYDDKVDRFFVAQPGAHGGSQVAIFDGSPIKYRTAVAVPSIGGGVAYDQAHDLVYATDVQPGKAGLYSFKPPAC